MFPESGALFFFFFFFLTPIFFSFGYTHTLRDGWQSIDIRGNEVGVLRKRQRCRRKRRGRVMTEVYHSQKRMRRRRSDHFVL